MFYIYRLTLLHLLLNTPEYKNRPADSDLPQ